MRSGAKDWSVPLRCLKRLLQLNHTRRAEEEADGLWDKETKKKGKVEKAKKEIETQRKLLL